MGCLGIVAAIILFSAGIDRLDKNLPLSLTLIGLSIIVALITWYMERKEDEV